jgi:predicted Zn-dependent protease
MSKNRRISKSLLALAAAAMLAGSPSAYAQGGGAFGISDEKAKQLGAQEHPKIVAEYGGEIEDPKIKAYVEGIARKLIAVSDKPNEPVVVTVLDSPVVNAFALPGHLYVTRGLMAYADSEAELAGVIGHELGHIFEKHTARRIKRGNLAGIGAAILGVGAAVLGADPGIIQTLSQGAQLYVMNFSRKQEYQADMVGVRLLAKANYDPTGAAGFLNTLGRISALEQQISGRAAPPEFLSTHPNTAERVRRAASEAKVLQGASTDQVRDPFLNRVDGMLFGDDPVKQGFVRGQDFIHPGLGFAFTAPQGMKLQNTSQAVIGQGQNVQMQFTGATSEQSPQQIVQAIGQQLKVQMANGRNFQVAGRQGATAVGRGNTQNGPVDAHVYVVKWQGASNWVFLWLTPAQFSGQFQPVFDQSVGSLRNVDARTANAPPAQRIQVVSAGANDTVASLAARTAFPDYKEQRFRIMNSLENNETVTPGYRVKLVK